MLELATISLINGVVYGLLLFMLSMVLNEGPNSSRRIS